MFGTKGLEECHGKVIVFLKVDGTMAILDSLSLFPWHARVFWGLNMEPQFLGQRAFRHAGMFQRLYWPFWLALRQRTRGRKIKIERQAPRTNKQKIHHDHATPMISTLNTKALV